MDKVGKIRRAGIVALLLGVVSGSTMVFAADGGITRLEAGGALGDRAVLELKASPLLSMTPIPFRLLLQNASGERLGKAAVTCSLDMPAMPMPANTARVREANDGYEGEATFTMPGSWQATFETVLPGGEKEVFLFDIEKVLLK